VYVSVELLIRPMETMMDVIRKIDDQRIGLELAGGTPRHLIVDPAVFKSLYMDHVFDWPSDLRETIEFTTINGVVYSSNIFSIGWLKVYIRGLAVSLEDNALEVTE